MIGAELLRPLLDALAPDTDQAHQRRLLQALVALPLAPDAWRAAAETARSAIDSLLESETVDASDMALAARIPLRSLRHALRRRACETTDSHAVDAAIALAEVGDDAGTSTLAASLRSSPTEDVARALALLPLEASTVSSQDLLPALAAAEGDAGAATRMWLAFALARLGEFEPLESLWDALVRPSTFFQRGTREYLFREPPPLFWGDPARTVGALARLRPMSDRVGRFVLSLRDNDFDESWGSRHPELVGSARNAMLLVAGLTGRYDQYGDPVPEAPAEALPRSTPADIAAASQVAVRLEQAPWRGLEPNAEADELRVLRHAPPDLAAEVMETAIEQLDATAVVAGRVPPFALGNAVVALAAALPSDLPLRAARVLAQSVIRYVPRESIAWALARAGAADVLRSLAPRIVASTGDARTSWLDWLVDVARQLGAPAPIRGAGGMEEAPPPVMDLVDDRAKKRARPPVSRDIEPAPPIVVYPNIATPTPHPVAGTSLEIIVSLGRERTASTRGGVRIPGAPPTETHTLRVHLLVGEHSMWETVDFSLAEGTTKPATFTLTTPAVAGERALVEVRTNFYLNNRWCGEGSRNLDVRRDANVPELPEIPLPPAPPWVVDLALETGAVPPDLMVRIQRAGAVGEYTWSCLSPHVTLTPPTDPHESHMALGAEAADYVRTIFGPVANVALSALNIADIDGNLEGLYASSPPHFKDSYWSVWKAAAERNFPFDSIQVVTDEPLIPWELMRVYDEVRGPGVEPEYLAVRHSIGRWLATESAGPPQRIRVSNVVVSASDYEGVAAVNGKLPWAAKEREFLAEHYHATIVPLRSDDILDLLASGDAETVHLACHGRMSVSQPNKSLLVMEDTPNDVTPPVVRRAEVRRGLGSHHPLIFLNACEVGRAAEVLSLVAGFPGAFLYAGASALISPLWVVNDERAFSIAREFYSTIFTAGKPIPIGRFLREVRKRWVNERHLTYLAYVLYGDPLACVEYAPAPPTPMAQVVQ